MAFNITIPEEGCIAPCCCVLVTIGTTNPTVILGADGTGPCDNVLFEEATTNALTATLFCDGEIVTTGVTWLITEKCREPNGDPECALTGNSGFMVSDTNCDVQFPANLDFSIDAPTDPDTTFTLTNSYPFGIGDFNVLVTVKATWQGHDFEVDVPVNFHTEIT